MSGLRFPFTDSFGTRVRPAALLEGLDACGLAGARLVLRDDGVTLEHDPAEPPGGDPVSLGMTWLRERLSPLTDCRAVPTEDLGEGPRVADRRTRPVHTVALAEVTAPERLAEGVRDLFARLGVAPPGDERLEVAPQVEAGGMLGAVAAELPRTATLSTLRPTARGLQVVGPATATPQPDGPHVLAWWRPGGDRGVRPALLLAASAEPTHLQWLVGALDDPPREVALPGEVLLDGLVWGVGRRPTVAVAATGPGEPPIRVDPDRCIECGACAAVCPVDYLDAEGRPTTDDPDACIRCYDCVELCPTDALRPVYGDDAATRGSTLAHRPGWLSRLRGAPGPLLPTPFPPSYLAPKRRSEPQGRPTYVLGLAVLTMAEHAAVLLRDGEIVGAVEEEKLVRIRHYGRRVEGRPDWITPAVDPTMQLEEVLCRRSIRVLLAEEGITADDVDMVAINGLHGRYRNAYSHLDADEPIPTLRAGRVVSVPHHLCHAASAFRVAPFDRGWIFTVDGRGDRETAALFRGEDGALEPVFTLLSLSDRSIGGVYQTITQHLGFGEYGQGSVMALAGFGEPEPDMTPFLSARSATDYDIHEFGLEAAFADRRREPGAPIEQHHRDLAASLQHALEEVALALVASGVDGGEVDHLGLAGGVTLNCHMNQRLRLAFRPQALFGQPAANDAGTALGAACEARGRTAGPMTHALLGPSFDDADIERALARSDLSWRRVDDVADEVAARIADGQVVCWFQGRLEFGPRALGGRSILADPRHEATKDRVNRLKEREPWRPFGPSILAGHEHEWFETAFDSRFMLFTLPVREDRRDEIPAVVHVDGTTRPQVVHADTHPAYHRMLVRFHERTGVPMVVNTSFNRRGEPIVCTPADALEAFADLGADALAIGSYLVEPAEEAASGPEADDDALAERPGGRRLSLRLTTTCNLDCVHCTLRDAMPYGERTFEGAVRALAAGREAGCDELVVMRGEPTGRADLLPLVRRARAMGYRFVQLQTHGASFADAGELKRALEAGVDAFEMMLLAGTEALHDELAGAPGAFRAIAAALRNVAASERMMLVRVPVLRRNLRSLRKTVRVLHRLGVRHVQLEFPRPVELPRGVVTEPLVALPNAAAHACRAAETARDLGMTVTTEGFPLCHLPEWLHGTPDATEDFGRHRVDDVHMVHDDFRDVRSTVRPGAEPCRRCAVRARCPKTWSLYLEMVGTGELIPLEE
ncbi:MAG: carbamoyltransferase C-terminal domain-containing protein [Myxococcota bacterium]